MVPYGAIDTEVASARERTAVMFHGTATTLIGFFSEGGFLEIAKIGKQSNRKLVPYIISEMRDGDLFTTQMIPTAAAVARKPNVIMAVKMDWIENSSILPSNARVCIGMSVLSVTVYYLMDVGDSEGLDIALLIEACHSNHLSVLWIDMIFNGRI